MNLMATQYEQILEGTDPVYLLSKNLRESIQYSFKSNNIKMEGSAFSTLGCSFKEFKKYIESQREEWMDWYNLFVECSTTRIGVSWAIRYKTYYQINTIEDIRKQNHYSNIIVDCHSEINKYN